MNGRHKSAGALKSARDSATAHFGPRALTGARKAPGKRIDRKLTKRGGSIDPQRREPLIMGQVKNVIGERPFPCRWPLWEFGDRVRFAYRAPEGALSRPGFSDPSHRPGARRVHPSLRFGRAFPFHQWTVIRSLVLARR
jgi:hypothetical protein